MANDTPMKVREADFDLEELEEECQVLKSEEHRTKCGARIAIAAAAFEAAVSPSVRRKLMDRKSPLAVVGRVPTPAWIGPIGAYFAGKFGTSWQRILRDGSDSRQHRADKGSAEVAIELTGRSVVGIAADAGILPATLVAAADLRINVEPPTATVI